MRKLKAGFTLIELLTVMVIVSIIAGMILAGLTTAKKNALRRLAASQIAALEAAVEQYFHDWGNYPPDNFGDTGLLPNPPTDHENDIYYGYSAPDKGDYESNECLILFLSSRAKGDVYIDLSGTQVENDDEDFYDGDICRSLFYDGDKTYLKEFNDPWGRPYKYICTTARADDSKFKSSIDTSRNRGQQFWIWSEGPVWSDTDDVEIDNISNW